MPHSDKAALRGEPSYVWRAGQQRRLDMVLAAAPGLNPQSRILENGCGLGMYIDRLRAVASPLVHGLDYELERVREAADRLEPALVVCGAGEELPYRDAVFALVLSNEVIEHVRDDRAAMAEMARVCSPGGRIVVFCPNRWYPVEQHGVYWRGVYHFGNIPLVNYLPGPVRDRLAPHVRAYTRRGLLRLCDGLPVRVVSHRRIFGGYDNIVGRLGGAGRLIRSTLHAAEGTPFDVLALSHLLVLERI